MVSSLLKLSVPKPLRELNYFFNQIREEKKCQKAFITTPYHEKVNKHCPLHHHKVSLRLLYSSEVYSVHNIT